LLPEVARRTGDYLAGAGRTSSGTGSAALAGLCLVDEPLPELAGDGAATLALLDEAGRP
jgi:hypothetical protein